MNNIEILLNCISAFNKCDLEWLNRYYSRNLEWNEMPRYLYPKGRSGGYLEYKNAAQNVLSIFPNRKLAVVRSFCDGNTVILEQVFFAVSAVTIGNIQKGDSVHQMILSIFEIKNELIIKQTDYISTINE